MNKSQFENLLQTVATGWNTKDARMAVECFSDNAIYLEPPDKQLVKGKDELYQYFGGESGADMKLTWHNLFFNQEKQSGVGEYTFEMNDVIHHGVAIVEIEDEKINFWREYDIPGTLTYEDFIKTEGKDFRFTAKDL